MRVADSHVHLLPSPLAQRVRDLFDATLPGQVVYPIEVRALLHELQAEGVGTVWALPYAHRPDVAGWMNQATAGLRDELAGGAVTIVAGATVHPGDEDPAGIVSHAVTELGARVLKLHCAVGTFELADPRLESVWDRSAHHRLPVVVHAGHDHMGRTADAHLAGVGHIADRHPDLPLIVAHLGHPATAAVIELMDQHPNLHADLTPVVADPVALDASDLARLSDRLLFGSDAPNTGVRVGALIERLEAAGLDTDAFGAITGGNAARLVGQVVADQ